MPQHSTFRRLSLLAALAVSAGCATSTAGRLPGPTVRAIETGGSLYSLGARADSAWKAESFVIAMTLFEAVVARDSSNSHAVFRLATLRSWDNRLDEGVRLFRRYVMLEPRDSEGRIALARALAWNGKYAASLAVYDSVIAQDRTYRDAVLGRAQTLGWAGRLDDALQTYRQWLAAHPTDHEASLEYARTLAWNGQLEESEKLYVQLAGSGDINAQKGLARVIAWNGELERSERAWRAVLDLRPDDAEALTGLAQSLHWLGRQSDAQSALQSALRVNPTYGEARMLLRWVEADLKPSVTMTAINTNDSDHNRATALLVDYAKPARWNTTIGGRYTARDANFATINGRSDALNLFARWQHDAWQLRGEAGATRHSASLAGINTPSETFGSGAVHASGVIARVLTVGAGIARAPFDETAALIVAGVVSQEYSGEAALALPGRVALSGAASHARLTGGARENTRNAYSSTLRWSYNRNWSLAATGRQFGYDTTSSDGYFSPRKYTLAEGSARGHLGGELGWNVDADAGLGSQKIKFFGSEAGARLAERAALGLGYRFDPSREMGLSVGYANVAAPGQTGGSEYRAYSVALRARLGF